MGGANYGNAGRRYRRRQRFRRSQRGVVAVVGTLLALLVFFALFGIFLTQYVPLWMTDNESQFTSQAQTSFANFKSAVDQQYVLDGPAVYGTAFTLSSQGIPLLAQPTQATLAFLPTTCPLGFYGRGVSGATPANYGQPVAAGYCVFENVTLSVGPGGSSLYSQHIGSGVLAMTIPNRYYTPQTFYFEDDAVMQSQAGGYQIVDFSAPLNVSVSPGNTSVTSSFLQLYGNSSTIIGQGSQQVFSHLRYAQVVSSNGKSGGTFSYLFEIGTQYPCAWSQYLQSLMQHTGLSPWTASMGLKPTGPYYNFTNPLTHAASVPVPSSACGNPAVSGTQIVALNLGNINYATVFYAGVQVVLGIGGT